MRYLFPANPLVVLIPLAIVAIILTPTLDPTTNAIAVGIPWLAYMALWLYIRRGTRKT